MCMTKVLGQANENNFAKETKKFTDGKFNFNIKNLKSSRPILKKIHRKLFETNPMQ